MSEEGCLGRVSDHTDWTDCGKPVLRAGYCADHLRQEIEKAQDLIHHHETGLNCAHARLERLTTESG